MTLLNLDRFWNSSNIETTLVKIPGHFSPEKRRLKTAILNYSVLKILRTKDVQNYYFFPKIPSECCVVYVGGKRQLNNKYIYFVFGILVSSILYGLNIYGCFSHNCQKLFSTFKFVKCVFSLENFLSFVFFLFLRKQEYY